MSRFVAEQTIARSAETQVEAAPVVAPATS